MASIENVLNTCYSKMYIAYFYHLFLFYRNFLYIQEIDYSLTQIEIYFIYLYIN